MIIVGIMRGGAWQIFAQITELSGALRAERIDV